MNELTGNYINVCLYCGKTYYSNRSTSKYCTKKHNALYHKYGTQIRAVPDETGNSTPMNGSLDEIYEQCHEDNYETDWSHALDEDRFRDDFGYNGPLPSGEELLLVGGYVIQTGIGQAWDGSNIYVIKPFSLLTAAERRTALII